ncbi:OLC1v1036247C1 [Oldenlandia corymbosa var. corymbosa]|uniref:OLC1v1036247C1 n=1 Tax=Oldenlandia corymbosa var. corymbosa TaxID=529605 RepID=A0AAV1CVD6_OLDCO|nr:OLC1v1036247C1 [Oldenlandia corymbosa var. corymbosa]
MWKISIKEGQIAQKDIRLDWNGMEAAGNWAVGSSIRGGTSGEILAEEGGLAADDHNLEESAAVHSIERKKSSCRIATTVAVAVTGCCRRVSNGVVSDPGNKEEKGRRFRLNWGWRHTDGRKHVADAGAYRLLQIELWGIKNEEMEICGRKWKIESKLDHKEVNLRERSFNPEIKDTVRRSKSLRNRVATPRVPKEDQKKMAEVATADQPQERELQPTQSRLLRDYFIPQEEEVQTPLVYNDVAAENFELKTQMIQWEERRATTKKAGVLELDATTHLQALMTAISSEISKLRADINKPKVDVCEICTGSHPSSTCQATMEEVQFVRQGNDREGFNSYNNWRPQQNKNWTNQQSNCQRSAQPPGFENQPFRIEEKGWIEVICALVNLDVTIKELQEQITWTARRVTDSTRGDDSMEIKQANTITLKSGKQLPGTSTTVSEKRSKENQDVESSEKKLQKEATRWSRIPLTST